MLTEVEIFKQSLDVSRIIMVITIITTIISITFSALTLAFQRSHNKRSVRPFCSINKINEIYKYAIYIKNSGLGPMIIKSIEIVNTEANIKLNNENQLKNDIKEISIKKIDLKDQLVISANEEKCILEIQIDENSKNKNMFNAYIELVKYIEECKMLVKYLDIYDKEYEIDI